VELGTELEDFVAKKFEKKSGFKTRRDSRDFTHPDYPYMTGHIDRMILDGESILECKTTSAWNFKDWKEDEIPQEYVLQLHWYLGLTERRKGFIAVLIGGQKFQWKEIAFDQGLWEKQVEAARIFWEEFVLKDIAPIAVAQDNEFLSSLYPVSQDTKADLSAFSEQVNLWIEERAGAIEAKKEAESAAKEIEAKIKQLLGESESGETDQYKISWKTMTKPEYTVKASSFRVLRCSPKKEEITK
jgi:predicted phage-related endonuclease